MRGNTHEPALDALRDGIIVADHLREEGAVGFIPVFVEGYGAGDDVFDYIGVSDFPDGILQVRDVSEEEDFCGGGFCDVFGCDGVCAWPVGLGDFV